MKFIAKSDLTYQNGYLVDSEGNVHQPAERIVKTLNELEVEMQRAAYLRDQKEKFSPADVEGKDFKPLSEHEIKVSFEIKTPLIDKEIENAMDIMAEIDRANALGKTKAWLEDHKELIEFLAADKFIESDCTVKFDLDGFGDPLKITVDDLVAALLAKYGYTPGDDEKE